MMPSILAPKPLSPILSGNNTPNSVAMLGPGRSWKAPSRKTYFRKAPAAARLVGPDGVRGVWASPSNTASQSLTMPKLRTVAGAISVFSPSLLITPAGWNSISTSPGSATAASVPSNGRYANAGAATLTRASNAINIPHRGKIFTGPGSVLVTFMVTLHKTLKEPRDKPMLQQILRTGHERLVITDLFRERRELSSRRLPLECGQVACNSDHPLKR